MVLEILRNSKLIVAFAFYLKQLITLKDSSTSLIQNTTWSIQRFKNTFLAISKFLYDKNQKIKKPNKIIKCLNHFEIENHFFEEEKSLQKYWDLEKIVKKDPYLFLCFGSVENAIKFMCSDYIKKTYKKFHFEDQQKIEPIKKKKKKKKKNEPKKNLNEPKKRKKIVIGIPSSKPPSKIVRLSNQLNLHLDNKKNLNNINKLKDESNNPSLKEDQKSSIIKILQKDHNINSPPKNSFSNLEENSKENDANHKDNHNGLNSNEEFERFYEDFKKNEFDSNQEKKEVDKEIEIKSPQSPIYFQLNPLENQVQSSNQQDHSEFNKLLEICNQSHSKEIVLYNPSFSSNPKNQKIPLSSIKRAIKEIPQRNPISSNPNPSHSPIKKMLPPNFPIKKMISPIKVIPIKKMIASNLIKIPIQHPNKNSPQTTDCHPQKNCLKINPQYIQNGNFNSNHIGHPPSPMPIKKIPPPSYTHYRPPIKQISIQNEHQNIPTKIAAHPKRILEDQQNLNIKKKRKRKPVEIEEVDKKICHHLRTQIHFVQEFSMEKLQSLKKNQLIYLIGLICGEEPPVGLNVDTLIQKARKARNIFLQRFYSKNK